MDILVAIAAPVLAVFALCITFYVGFMMGKAEAAKNMNDIMSELITTCKALIKKVEKTERIEPTLKTPAWPKAAEYQKPSVENRGPRDDSEHGTL